MMAARANSAICRRLADVDAMHRDLLRMCAVDLGGDRRKPGFVAIGQRQVAAARRKLERQRASDPTGGAGQGCRGSPDGSHFNVAPCQGEGSSPPQTLYGAPAMATAAPHALSRHPVP